MTPNNIEVGAISDSTRHFASSTWTCSRFGSKFPLGTLCKSATSTRGFVTFGTKTATTSMESKVVLTNYVSDMGHTLKEYRSNIVWPRLNLRP